MAYFKSRISYLKFPIGGINQFGIGDLFSDSALPDSYIPYSQLDILFPIGNFDPQLK